jgi:threonine synthase
LEQVRRTFTRSSLARRPASIWRYAELLPIVDRKHIVSLGEGWTPLVRLTRAEGLLPVGKLWVKREEQNPTGSFKARGFAVSLSVAAEYGIRKTAVNSNGNAASAMAAYAARAGIESYVFVPKDCPGPIVRECKIYGAHTYLVDGLIHDAGQIVREGAAEQGWFSLGTMQEHGRAEGKKTMGLELAEQFGWRLPDTIIYPTGGGSGIIGMWNAFQQLKRLGLLQGDLPRLISVQEQGCHPLVDALQGGGVFQPAGAEVDSMPTGMRVPNPPDGQLIADILRQSGGTAVAVTADEIRNGAEVLGKHGISASPEGAAAWAGLVRLVEQGVVGPKEEVVLFNTAHAMKYLPWKEDNAVTVRNYQEWRSFVQR